MLGKKRTLSKVHKKQRLKREEFKRLEGDLKPVGKWREDSNWWWNSILAVAIKTKLTDWYIKIDPSS